MPFAEEAFQQMRLVADVVNMNCSSASFWQSDVEAIALIGPCIHFLLSMSKLPGMLEESDQDAITVLEMIRLTGLSLMAGLKEKFSFAASEKDQLQKQLVCFVCSNATFLYPKYSPIIEWVLVSANLLAHGGQCYAIREAMAEFCVAHDRLIEDAIQATKGTVWINSLESVAEQDLKRDINQLLDSY